MQNAAVSFVLTGPDPLLFPAWRDLDMGNHRIVNLRNGVNDQDGATVWQVNQIPKGPKGDPGDPGGSIDYDTIADALADYDIDLSLPWPGQVNGVNLDVDSRVLFT